MNRTDRVRAAMYVGRMWLALRLPRLGLFIVLDVVVAGLGYVLMVAALFSRLPRLLHDGILGSIRPGTPSDFNGTAWFYWWYEEAHSRSVDVLHADVVCSPTGQHLAANFPNQLDALFARFFFDRFIFPESFNLFLFAIMVVSAMAGYLGLRTLTRSRVLAFIGGAFFGLSSYGISEAAGGRPTLSLVAFIPLFIACWLRLLEARGRGRWVWGILASVFAVLSIHHYILYALFLALFAFLSGVARLVIPAKGVSRWRPVMAMVLVGTFSLCGSAAYLKQLVQWRPIVTGGVEHRINAEPAFPTGEAPSLYDPTLQMAQELAPPVDYLWGGTQRLQSEGNRTQFFIPSILILAAMVLLPLSRLRGLGWLGATVFFYCITLGPAASIAAEEGKRYLTVGDGFIPLPTYLLFWKFPSTVQFWHCERAFPLVLFCLLACLTVGLERVARYPGWLRINPDSLPARRMLVILLAIPIGYFGLQELDRVNARSLDSMTAWAPHPFLEQLAAEDGDFGIIDLPLGIGDGLGLKQIVHGRPRANGHHDDLRALLNGSAPPPDCYQLPLLQGLWDLQLVAQGSVPPPRDGRFHEILPSTDPGAIQEAMDAGFRYVVLFRRNVWVDRHFTSPQVERRYLDSLRRIFGSPSIEDSNLMVWALEDATAP